MRKFTYGQHQNYADWRLDAQKYFDETSLTYNCYWLLDPCVLPGLQKTLWDIDPDIKAWPLFMNTYLEEVVQSGPLLVAYANTSKTTDWLFEQIALCPLGYLLLVDQSEDSSLFEHLQNLLECITPQGKTSLFRYYDPRIIYALTTYEDEAMLKQILGPALALYGWEHGRGSAFKAGDGIDHGFRCTEKIQYPEEMFDHIWREVKIHTLIERLSENFIETYPDASVLDIYDELEKVFRYLLSMDILDSESYELAGAITAYFSSAAWNDSRILEKFFGSSDKPTLNEILSKRENK